MATKARLDVLFAKSRMNGAYACPIGSGKSRFAPSSPDSISQFETSSNTLGSFGQFEVGAKRGSGKLLPISVQLAFARQGAKEQGESDDGGRRS